MASSSSSMQQECLVQGIDFKPLLEEYLVAQKEMHASEAEHQAEHQKTVDRFMELRRPILNLLKHNVDDHKLAFGDHVFTYVTRQVPKSSGPTYETTLHALEEIFTKSTQMPRDEIPQFALHCANYIWDCIPREEKESMMVQRQRQVNQTNGQPKRKQPSSLREKALKRLKQTR